MYLIDFNYYKELDVELEIMCLGGSCIVDFFGKYVVGFIFNKEEMLIVDLDLEKIVFSRLDFDLEGYYLRLDVFELIVYE